jgi:hypothetical protein
VGCLARDLDVCEHLVILRKALAAKDEAALPRTRYDDKKRAREIAIIGAGIAGTTLAYWLRRSGNEPVLIEQAPRLRTAGYVIDFWGIGYDVAEK